MMYYFAWMESPETLFDEKVHTQMASEILSLHIEQKETAPQTAEITLGQKAYQAKVTDFQEGRWAYISCGCESTRDVRVLFRGRLIGTPVKVTATKVVLKLVAQVTDVAKEEDRFVEKIKEDKNYWDELFDYADQKHTPLLASAVWMYLPYWNPQTGLLEKSGIFEGTKEISYGDEVLQEGFSWVQHETPLAQLAVSLKANWMQEANGEMPVGHLINQAQHDGFIATYTPEKLQQQWWPVGMSFHGGAYEICQSRLEEMEGPETLDRESENRHPTYFRAHLVLHWRYYQRREETLDFVVTQNLTTQETKGAQVQWQLGDLSYEKGLMPWQPDTKYAIGSRVLVSGKIFQCQAEHISGLSFWEGQEKWKQKKKRRSALPEKAAASFMSTNRGKEAIAHAIQRAKVLLAHSARCVRVTFALPLSNALGVSLDHTVCLTHPCVPGGAVKGKVAGYSFKIDGETNKALATIGLAVSLGQSEERHNDQVVDLPTLSGVGDIPGLVNPKTLTPPDILQRVEIENGLQEQESQLLTSVGVKGTKISLYLKDLHPVENLTYQWRLVHPACYSPPKQTTL